MSDEGKLFVGGLNFETNDEGLEAAFAKYGEIEKADVIRDRETGSSRGFGFVKYGNPEDAKDAMAAMNGKSLDGRTIRVDYAGRGGRGGRGGGGGGGFGGSKFGQSRGRGGYRDGGYGDRSYGDRSYQSREYTSGYRSGGGSSYRDNRSQGGYDRGTGGNYRETYDYATNE